MNTEIKFETDWPPLFHKQLEWLYGLIRPFEELELVFKSAVTDRYSSLGVQVVFQPRVVKKGTNESVFIGPLGGNFQLDTTLACVAHFVANRVCHSALGEIFARAYGLGKVEIVMSSHPDGLPCVSLRSDSLTVEVTPSRGWDQITDFERLSKVIALTFPKNRAELVAAVCDGGEE